MTTHSLHGIPLLAALDRIPVSNIRLTALLVAAGAGGTGILSLLFADWVSTRSAQPVTAVDISFSVFNGAVAGLGLGLARAAAQHLEQSVRVALAFDRRVLERLDRPTPQMRRRWLAMLLIAIFVLQAWMRLFREAGEVAGGALDAIHRLYLLAPLLLNFAAGGLLVLAFGTAVVLLRWLARGIDPDLRRLDAYSCFALPPLYLVAALSIALGAGTATVVFFEGTGEIATGYLIRNTLMFVIALPLSLLPMWEIHRSIVALRDAERERVIRALDGDADGLVGSKVDRRADGGHGEWMSYLLWLDALPTWPLGGYVQRIVLFGLLPPITWVMAAAVENLLF
ncbi:MAG: hypothetical protein MK142_02320 [Pseudomonadales bacterium]|nr:hypothetical protein [Pseudomonadales bacterium]